MHERKTRAEFLKTFRVPSTIDEAYIFGRQSAVNWHGCFSFAEFFANDMKVRRVPNDCSRQDLWHAYLRGRAAGVRRREAIEERKAAET